MNGMTARSANGSSLLPGRMIAKNMVIGTNKSPTAITDGSPSDTAASSPMKISLSPKCFAINSLAASEMGISPSIRIATIFGIRYMTAAIVIASCKIASIFCPPRRPSARPMISPMDIGSPKIPKRFRMVSGLAFSLFRPGILSISQFRGTTSGRNPSAVKCGKEMPGIPKNFSTYGWV